MQYISSGDLVIPSTLGGYPVTGIGSYAFSYCTSLASVTIGDNVTSIGKSAFHNCTNLTSVIIPSCVINIGSSAFSNCTNLVRVYYKGDLESWCRIEFGYYNSNPMYYAKNFYINNMLVKAIVIPDTITEIKNYAFYGFDGIVSVTIPNSVTNIGYDAFNKCTSLEQVYYTGDIELWCNIEFGNGYANPMCCANDFFINNIPVKKIIIPDTVSEIKAYTFCNFKGLTNVTIPDSVTIIGSSSFYGCTGLVSVALGNSVESIGTSAFYNCTGFISVTIGNGVKSIGSSAFYNCNHLTSVTIGNSIASIGSGAFAHCNNLKDVYYTGDITSWSNISLDDNKANPMYYAENFYINGELIENLVIPDGECTIKTGVFYGMKCVKNVTIPESVIAIYENAFYDCENIRTVCYGGTESQWDEIVIYGGNNYLVNAEITFINGGHEHSYNSSVTIEPTCTETGVKTFKCSCGDSYIESIPATGHTWTKWIVTDEPTETDDGFKVRTCKVCEDAGEVEVLPATGSGDGEKTGITITLTDEKDNVVIKEIVSDYNTDISFENGTYTLTISKENYVSRTYTVNAAENMMSVDFSLNRIGDINGDGKVNTMDVARANASAKGVNALAGYELACADTNGDGKVNTMDVARMNAHAKGVTALW